MLYNISVKFLAGDEISLAKLVTSAECANILSAVRSLAVQLFKQEFGDKKKLVFGEVQPHLNKDIIHVTSFGGTYNRLYAIISITPDTDTEVTHAKKSTSGETDIPLPTVRESGGLWS